MSRLEVPPADVLAGDRSPYTGFGPPLIGSMAEQNFAVVLQQAKERIEGTFDLPDLSGSSGVEAIERVISEMWHEDWDPAQGDVNLFTRDLGALLMAIVSSELGGERVFRSTTDLSHASVFWSAKRIEAFPFHKAYKRLCNRDGESLPFFLDALRRKLA